MQIDATKDFNRPRKKVLNQFRSPEKIEKVLAGMNVTATRIADAPQPVWDCTFNWRDGLRRFKAQMTETAPAETMVLSITSDLADGTITMDFYDLPEGGCRVIAKADMQARTMMVRLALQSLRLVRGKAEDRLTRLITAIGRP